MKKHISKIIAIVCLIAMMSAMAACTQTIQIAFVDANGDVYNPFENIGTGTVNVYSSGSASSGGSSAPATTAPAVQDTTAAPAADDSAAAEDTTAAPAAGSDATNEVFQCSRVNTGTRNPAGKTNQHDNQSGEQQSVAQLFDFPGIQ